MNKKISTSTIVVQIESVEEKDMYLHEHLGDGTFGNIKFDASTVLPSRDFLVTVGGKKYLVSSASIIKGIIDHHIGNNTAS